MKRQADNLVKPAKLNAPISLTSPDRIKLTLQNHRLENKALKKEIEKLQLELKKSSVNISTELNDDMKSIMSDALDKSSVSPFMKFFWSEQQKYLSCSKNSVRYHPMIIRYCLAMASKSSAVYDDIRYDDKTGTGFLILPSKRRLRDYKNYIRPQRGFNKGIINELKSKVEKFSDEEKFMCLLQYLMK